MSVRGVENSIGVVTVIAVGPAADGRKRAANSSTFHVFLNGNLHSVIRGNEAFLRDTVIALSHLHPDDSWGYAPVHPPEGFET